MKQKLFSHFLFLNGHSYHLQTYKLFHLKHLLFYFSYKENLIVLEYNGKIYTSKNWSLLKLSGFDTVETITIVGGG